MKKNIGLYLHIPFCISKCRYCDFLSKANQTSYFEPYVQALVKEIQAYGELLISYEVDSIFIGGGTPTILPIPLLEKILFELHRNFTIIPTAEITIEANPGTLSKIQLQRLNEININRLSIGLQAYQDSLLQKLGRGHRLEQFLENYAAARAVGFNNISIDLMFGLPEQKLEHWEETLSQIITLNPEHLSCYSLIIEEGTPFHILWDKNQLQLPTEDETLYMYRKCISMLTQAGYEHYEISNFAKRQKESKHNLKYWTGQEYIGLGVGAHSFFEQQRYNNIENIKQYIEKSHHLQKIQINHQMITLKESYEETMFLGLRLIDGVSMDVFYERFQKKIEDVYGIVLNKMVDQELLKIEQNKVKLTSKGLEVGNLVFEQFLLE